MRTATLGFLLIAFAAPALASDGVMEINQTCAVQTGCFSGDSAGLPVTIVRSGSYVLTSDLNTGGIGGGPSDLNAIEVGVSDVTLDMAGFSIRCRNVFPPQSCAGGSGVGVLTSSDSVGNLTLRDGSVLEMGGDGIVLNGQDNVIESLRVVGNGGSGVVVNRPSIPNPIGPDIAGTSRSTIRESTVNGNGLVGIVTGASVFVIDGCLVYGNAGGDVAMIGSFVGGVVLRDTTAETISGPVTDVGGNGL